MDSFDRDETACQLKSGYVWAEAKKSKQLTEIFNQLDHALEEFAHGARGPEGLLLEPGYAHTPEVEVMVGHYRAMMRDPVQRLFNICGCVHAMLDDDDEFPQIETVADGLEYLKKGYGL